MSRGQRLRLILVLGSLIAVGPLTIDMYLPALPAIVDDFAINSATVQLTLTGTLVGLAVGQLVIGPLSDALGRRAPLIAGTALHVVASVGCALAPNITVLGALRVVQGLGAAAAAVIAMAVVRDLFSGTSFARVLSRLLLVMGAAPVLAPTLGSELLRWTQWRGIFAALVVFGVLLMLIAALGLPETLPPGRRQRGGVLSTARLYRSLLRDRAFVGLVLVAALAMAAIFAYVAGSSFVLQGQYGLSEQQFGFAFGAGAIGLIGATQGNVRLLRRYPPQRILMAALLIGAVAALVLLGVAVTGFGGLPALLASLWLVLAATGLAMPNAPALALSRHGEAAGTASALLGAVQFGVGALTAPLVGVLGNGAAAMGLVIAGGLLAALVVLLLVVRPDRLAMVELDPVAVAVH
ncbi:Bcr/CflA family drug resistance efflux transporter [Micromonospora endophytica]|uniref:Bcr/CflA family drug resistance efflux transporter n=2 Tax=Micromonospora endophytica TaxID=515350 RepID=A0A2W2DMU7_9ACTN|nr:Bcr/CflA family drug resistance efflux transporter [Micromonospora endophytica]RIW47992.1 Bcr/CflA family efflux MFS transporter [Micromonospora endophytica]